MYAIVGPTGSGKTEAAIKLAHNLGRAALLSADSRQVYRGMDIGTAKQKDTGSTPQYLVDIREPDEPLTLAEWQQAAFAIIDRLIADGTTPPPERRACLLVGGTMLYIDSVVYNYAIPQVEPDEAMRAELEVQPVDKLYAELLKKDPAAKAFIQPQNKRRIIRALEVIAKTGRPFSESRRKREPKYDVQMLGLMPSWEELEKRLRTRAETMLTAGLVEETQRLINRFGSDLPLLQTLNYKQALEFMAGRKNKQETIEEMTRVNLRYARRQMSWWRGRKEITWSSSVQMLLEQLEDDGWVSRAAGLSHDLAD